MNNKQTPFFSIVIPVYNREDSIRETLVSCLEQTWQDFEVIVVDDGSTDGTTTVVSELSAQDARIRLLKKTNGGPAAARNLGVLHATGRYVAFLDSDDRFLPEKLEHFAGRIDESGAGFLYGPVLSERGNGSVWIRPESGLRPGEDIFDYLFLRRGVILPSTVVVERVAAERFPFLETLWFGDNDQFAVDLWRAGIEFEFVEEPMTRYADQEDAFRLSRLPLSDSDSPRHRAYYEWVESRRAYISERAYLAYRARFLSRISARDARMRGLADIVAAWRGGALSAPATLRQLVQSYAPGLYRLSADLVARFRGVGSERV